MICGIYQIINNINGHYYVGQSVDITKRFREHKFHAKNLDAKDHNSPIHRAMYKYGIENFSLKILEHCSKEQLNEREIYWIDVLKATDNNNYNILKGGQDHDSFKGKPVELYDLSGNYVTTLPSATEVAEFLSVSRNSIYGVLQKERPTCKGYQMKYKEDKDTVVSQFISKQGGTKSVAQIDPETNKLIKIYSSAAQAARETGADSSTIIKVCKGKLKTTKGYQWIYWKGDEI